MFNKAFWTNVFYSFIFFTLNLSAPISHDSPIVIRLLASPRLVSVTLPWRWSLQYQVSPAGGRAFAIPSPLQAIFWRISSYFQYGGNPTTILWDFQTLRPSDFGSSTPLHVCSSGTLRGKRRAQSLCSGEAGLQRPSIKAGTEATAAVSWCPRCESRFWVPAPAGPLQGSGARWGGRNLDPSNPRFLSPVRNIQTRREIIWIINSQIFPFQWL